MSDPQPPRYRPARCLPDRAYVPGRGAKPMLAEEPATYLTADRWRDNAPYLWGVDLYNHRYAWEAHEAWEGVWRVAKHDEAQADFLQGLIQCAAARLKAIMGDARASHRLLMRGVSRLARVHAEHGDHYMGLELARYLAAHRHGADGSDFPKLWLKP